MIEQISGWLDQIVQLLNRLNSMPALGLVLASSWVVGWIVKRTSCVHNSAIPIVVTLWGAALNPFLSDFQNSPLPFRIWLARNIVVGAIVSITAWGSHRLLWKGVIMPKIQVWFPAAAKELDTSPPIPLPDGSNVKPKDQ